MWNPLSAFRDWLRGDKRAKAPGKPPASFASLLGSWLGGIAGWSSDKGEQVRHFRLWTYIAIRAIAEEIASQTPVVARRLAAKAPSRVKRWGQRKALISGIDDDRLDPVDFDHPLSRLLSNPNDPDTGFTFWYRTAMYLELTGSCYWWISAENGLGLPAELWVLPSHWCWPRRTGETDELVDYYEIRPHGVGIAPGGNWATISAEDIIAIHYPNPLSPVDGFSPTSAAGEWVDIAESIDSSHWFSFRQGAWPGMVVKLGPEFADPDEETINRVRARGEHVFAGLEQLGGKCVRAMTLARNELAILLKCAAYNAKRLVWLVRHDPCGCAR